EDRILSDAEVAIALAGATLVVDEPVDAQTRRQNGQKKDQLGRQGEITGAEAGSLRSNERSLKPLFGHLVDAQDLVADLGSQALAFATVDQVHRCRCLLGLV